MNKLLFSQQSSFRLLHSVLTCLLKCTNDWELNLENSEYTAVTFIDLKKAFDIVNHDILIQKLTGALWGSKQRDTLVPLVSN